MIVRDAFFSSKTDMWSTPQKLFDELDAEFHFNLDACAVAENAKCRIYFSPEEDGLSKPWLGTVFCNPPYGKEIGKWVGKAWLSSQGGNTVVMILPARTDTAWFHDYVYGKAEIRFIRGRLKFGGAKYNAPFPTMIVVFRGNKV